MQHRRQNSGFDRLLFLKNAGQRILSLAGMREAVPACQFTGYHHASFTAFCSTTTSGLVVRLRAGGRGQKLFPAIITAKVERLSVAFGVEGGFFVHVHSAIGVLGHGFRCF
jgi:hypothetical protein